jgi:hypothetical protein
MRVLSALWVASLLWLFNCSGDDLRLYELQCVENGQRCTGECCDPAAVCRALPECGEHVGVCVVPAEAGAP